MGIAQDKAMHHEGSIASERLLRDLTIEKWRDVVGFEANYEVSSDGSVRSKLTGRVLRPWVAAKHYYYVDLRSQERKRKVAVHVLVAEAFHGPKPYADREVAHSDGDGIHNQANNLRWATHAENVQDQRMHGTLRSPVMRGASHPRAKLGDEAVAQIRQAYCGRRGQLSELARLYRVHRRTVSRVVTGEGWMCA